MDRGLRAGRAVALLAAALVSTGCVSKNAFVAKTAELNGALAALEQERRRTADLSARAADLEAKLAEARGEAARLRSELTDVSGQRETVARQLALVQESASQKDVNLRQLTARYDDLIKDLERQKGDLSKRVTALSGQLAEAETQVSTLTAERQRLEADLNAERQALSTAQADLTALRATLGDTRAQLAERERKLRETTTTYDKLVSDLKGEIANGQVRITQLRDKLTVNLVDKILFDSGSTVIKPRGREVLQKVAEVLRPVTDKRIQIEGHTDNVPIAGSLQARFPTNWELSVARATVVARFLQDQGGLDPTRLVATGYGEYHPVASNDTLDGRAENRRIEIVLMPLGLEAAVQ